MTGRPRTEAQTEALNRLFRTLDEFRGVYGNALVSELMALIFLAIDPEPTRGRLRDRLSLHDAAQSSQLAKLAAGSVHSPGLNLIEAQGDKLKLTSHGEIVVGELAHRLEGTD